MIKTSWLVLIVAFLNISSTASATPVVVVECRGRSWTHQIWGENKFGPFRYVQVGWGTISEFEVERLIEASSPFKYLFRNEGHVFGLVANVSGGVEKTVQGRIVRTGTGAMYRKDGFTNDQIRECWVDSQILQPF